MSETHLHKSVEYHAWSNMRERCRNPHHKSYANYGGRGITISPLWDTFAAFLADMGRRPDDSFSLDRIDNDGNYEPGNCRWATRSQQQQNKRKSATCQRGHLLAETRIYGKGGGTRCRTCRDELNRARPFVPRYRKALEKIVALYSEGDGRRQEVMYAVAARALGRSEP